MALSKRRPPQRLHFTPRHIQSLRFCRTSTARPQTRFCTTRCANDNPCYLKLPPDWSWIFARIESGSEIFCTHAYSSGITLVLFLFSLFVSFLHSFIDLFFIHSLMLCLCGECPLIHCLSRQWPGRHNRINHQLIPSCRRLNNPVSIPTQTIIGIII